MKIKHPERRELKRLFGHRVRFDEAERRLYRRDVSNPPLPVQMMIKQLPEAVVFPESGDELVDLLRFAHHHGIPLVPRGGGSAGYGGAMPVKGGIVVDMTQMGDRLRVSAEGTTATIDAGMSFWDAELRLNQQGKALCIMPTSARGATLGGWLAQGGAGLGSLRYGWVQDVVVAAHMVLPNGDQRTFSGEELDVVADLEGTTGFITSVTVKIRDNEPLVPLLATYPDVVSLQSGVQRLQGDTKPWAMLVHDPEFNQLRQETTGLKNVPKGRFSVVMAYEQSALSNKDDVRRLVEATGGKLEADDKAASEWDQRFGVFRAKRLGPSMVPGEAVVPTARIGESIARVHEAVKAKHWCMEGVVAGDQTIWFAFALDDERRAQFPAAFGAAIAMLDAVKPLGGRTLGTGVYMSNLAPTVFAADRMERAQAFGRAVDPAGIMNPGKVFGAPIRFKPAWAPGPSVAGALAPGNPLLKMAHGSSYVQYQRSAEARAPYKAGLSAALGAAGGADFGARWAWDAIVADTDVSIRFASASARAFKQMAASPLGWVRWAREYMCGKDIVSPYQFQMLHGEGLAASAELQGELGVPYTRLLQDFKTHLVDQGFRPLPPHQAAARHIAKEHNQFGAPHAERMDWAEGLDIGDKGDVLLFVDDTVAYKMPHIARHAEELLRRAGKRVATLGAEEWSSGAILLHTGQREAARETIRHNIEAIQKSGIKELVTPDAYAYHVFKNDYAEIAASEGFSWTVKVFHLHEYVANAIEAGTIPEGGAVNTRVALHHPPVLTLNGVTEDMALKVLRSIPGLEVVQLAHHGRDALDVAASGGVPEAFPEICDKAARAVIAEAQAAGADIVVSTDPASELILQKTGARIASERGIDTHPDMPELGAPVVDQDVDEPEGDEVEASTDPDGAADAQEAPQQT